MSTSYDIEATIEDQLNGLHPYQVQLTLINVLYRLEQNAPSGSEAAAGFYRLRDRFSQATLPPRKERER